MLTISPTTAFTAINPPLWLTQEIAGAQARMPNMRLLVLFHDDLKGVNVPDRTRELRGMLKDCWDENPFTFSNLAAMASQQMAEQLTDYAANDEPYINPLTGAFHYRIYPMRAGTAALVTLPKRHLSAPIITAQMLGVSPKYCAPLPEVNPQHALLRHELVHNQQQATVTAPQTVWESETEADLGAIATSMATGHMADAQYLADLRAADAFAMPISSVKTDRWNTLALAGIKHEEADEVAGMLELKLRCLDSDTRITRPAELFAPNVFVGVPAQALRQCFSNLTYTDKIRSLERTHSKNGYTFEHSHWLADRVLNAAHRLTPGAF